MDGRSDTKPSLDEELRLGLVLYVCDPGKYFLPHTALDSIVKEETVYRCLEEAKLDLNGETSLAKIMQYIFDGQGARKVFAILVLLERVASVVDFMKCRVYDQHLPLIRRNEVGANFELVRTGCSQESDMSCFQTWRQMDIQQFDNSQWYMMAPIFEIAEEGAKFYQIPSRAIFPWLSYGNPAGDTNGSVVRKVEIHKDHYRFPLQHGTSFALKVLKSQERPEFELEVAALKKIKPNAHLVTLLTSYEYQDSYHLLFGWAEGGSLFDLWQTHFPQPRCEDWALWLAEQCLGLAAALHRVHNTQLSFEGEYQSQLPVPVDANDTWDKTCGRHGDIKPQNILWFRQEENCYQHGVLKISDFGSARFHSALTTKVPSFGVAVSQAYQPPECELGDELSRPFDIWSLGCLYLEFITWLLKGWEGVELFSDKRKKERGGKSKFYWNVFFNIRKGSEPASATVKVTVTQWLEKLKRDRNCSNFLCDFIDYVEEHMMLVERHKRHTSGQVREKLRGMYQFCQKDSTYFMPRPQAMGSTSISESNKDSIP